MAKVHRDVPDTGPPPGIAQLQDDDYATLAQRLREEQGSAPLQVFAYGSLIWKPTGDYGPGRHATAFGWHRAFCLKLVRFRGTAETPGLMMALDRGGSCRGLVYPLLGDDPAVALDLLLRREMTNKPPTNVPRWVNVATAERTERAIAFTVNRTSWAYQREAYPEDTARILARACGHWGSCADYLHNAVVHLAQHGIHDRNLWRLQELVARQIEEDHGNVEGQ